MKKLKAIFMIMAALVLASRWAMAGGVKIIANSSISANAVSSDELKSVFLEESDSLQGSHVEPVLAKGGAAHDAFLKQFLDKNDTALQVYYRSLVFTGKGSMPKTGGSDAEIVSLVAKTKGAIGYVSADAAAVGVKTLDVK